MKDPFKIEGPALISFSGGRTSGYMLWQIIQAHGGALPPDVIPVFANTGKEMPQTLDFVRDCGERWGVKVVWLEHRLVSLQNTPGLSAPSRHDFAIVDYETANRDGRYFRELIIDRRHAPGPAHRWCTVELKIRTMSRYGLSLGWPEFDKVVGLRADEMHRVTKMRGRAENSKETGERDILMPLADTGVTKAHVSEFWSRQNFDLRLPNIGGITPHGNCDLCFLKSAATLSGIMRDLPERAAWWIELETHLAPLTKTPNGAFFRIDRPSYAEMFKAVQEQRSFDFGIQDEIIDCFCGDAA